MLFCNLVTNLLFILQTISRVVYTISLHVEDMTEWLLNSSFSRLIRWKQDLPFQENSFFSVEIFFKRDVGNFAYISLVFFPFHFSNSTISSAEIFIDTFSRFIS